MNNRALTISDIAHTAGVSKTTISRYINGKFEYMSEETRQRIHSVITLTGYQPNNIARSLKSQKSLLVGLVVADIESPFSSAAIKSVGDAMRGTGYNIITANSDNQPEKEQACIQSMLGQQVDGLIVNTTTMQNPYLISLANNGTPLVLLDRFVSDYNFDIAYLENRQPVFHAVDHLLEMGYGKVAFFTQPHEQISPRAFRREAFLEKLTLLGVQSPTQYVYTVDTGSPQSVCDALSRLVVASRKDSAPPAIIATNGVTLMYVLRAARVLGLSLPQEIGICGYDEWGWASDLVWTGLAVGVTTLTSSIHRLGELTAAMLLNRIADAELPKRQVGVPVELMIRGSTQLKNST